jgi:hypothetical protein
MVVERWVPHAAERWAQAVTGIMECPSDPKTVGMWAKAIGVGEGTLRDWCRAAHCRPKPSLDCARLLRAIVQAQAHGWDPFNLLDVVNERTMKNLLQRGGMSELLSTEAPLTPRDFVAAQRYITDAAALEALKAAVDARMTTA